MTTTSGQISITPVQIRTTASLDTLRDAMLKTRYTGQTGTRGWGSVRDETDRLVGQVLLDRPHGGAAEAVLRGEDYPAQLRGRLYWDETDSAVNRIAAQAGQVGNATRLQAADVTIAETSESGVLLGLLGERNESKLKTHVYKGLEEVLKTTDPKAMLQVDSNPLEFGDDDFFRWLIFRDKTNPVLNNDLSVVDIRAMSNQDPISRPTNMSHGIDLGRLELLALLANRRNKFGPSKFMVYSNVLQLGVSLEVNARGQFSIYRGGSEYDYPVGEQPLTHEEEGLKLVQDVAFHILPDLQLAHNGDPTWDEAAREKFAQDAKNDLLNLLGLL